ncbi:hypothetical protein IC620_00890 [Hazenella sp. IB182357]|uniref:Uncharacterized protein n=1 Tax=Polycladospora coralii TaxID=2771432 RepID=A0A926N815_9BACL|nr:hypothetical protein [Polycladospora coralii]MBD1370917.1 hypothetical protein [Polycladospora coralii]MBS7529856.1 hypothetical protein [Polycladospora coralii]
MNENLSMKDLTQMINGIMGQKVLSEQQLERIMDGAKLAHQKGGMPSVLEYLMKVTQADVDMKDLKKFADDVQHNPNMGMDILKGNKNIKPNKRKKR